VEPAYLNGIHRRPARRRLAQTVRSNPVPIILAVDDAGALGTDPTSGAVVLASQLNTTGCIRYAGTAGADDTSNAAGPAAATAAAPVAEMQIAVDAGSSSTGAGNPATWPQYEFDNDGISTVGSPAAAPLSEEFEELESMAQRRTRMLLSRNSSTSLWKIGSEPLQRVATAPASAIAASAPDMDVDTFHAQLQAAVESSEDPALDLSVCAALRTQVVTKDNTVTLLVKVKGSGCERMRG
jgi:hypothetical protein